VKGKPEPNDIDILIIYKEKENLDLNYAFKKQMQKMGLEVAVTSKSYKNIFSPSFTIRESILAEGFSLINNMFYSKGLGYTNFVLFKYDLKQKTKSERMMFYYSLHGRNKSRGMLNELKAIKFSDAVLFCPIESVEEMRSYFNEWNIETIEFPILVPARIADSEVLNKTPALIPNM
ncbi:MAG: hypothetical protein Q8O89_00785, partial [Nanoarchaeota archaeon]|nr:hypothetical protein [Nanoarchaeota archaeon]